MQQYRIVFIYMDGQSVSVTIAEDKKTEFLKCLGKGEVFFDEQKKSGVWLPINQIRYFRVNIEDAATEEPMDADDEGGAKTLPKRSRRGRKRKDSEGRQSVEETPTFFDRAKESDGAVL